MRIFKHLIVVIFIVLCSVFQGLGQTGISTVRENCRIQRNNVLVCRVGPNGLLKFEEIRVWTKFFKKNTVEVYCSEGGSVFLPWPVKAKNLNKFFVRGCIIKGYLSEYNSDFAAPDSMKDLKIIDCNIETKALEFFKMVSKIGQFSKSYDCGQTTLKILTLKNISYTFLDTSTELENIGKSGGLLDAGDAILEESKAIQHRCVYSELEDIDESISRSRSKFHFQLATQNSEYPELKYYNFSDNLLSVLPVQLSNWSVYYPKLEYLDISNNKLQTFKFSAYKGSQVRRNSLTVDMRRNLVEKIPSSVLEMFKSSVPILVDLRDNPIHCDCEIIPYKEYLELVSFKYPNFDVDVKCATPPGLKGRQILTLTKDILKCSNKF